MELTMLTMLQAVLDARFHGVLTQGQHPDPEDSHACALELLSVVQGKPWTDDPETVRTFDVRALNDLEVPDAVRTTHFLPVLAAYAGSLDWPLERQQRVVARLVILTVQRLIAELPSLPEDLRSRCRRAATVEEARAAAEAAEEAAAGRGSVTGRPAWVTAEAAILARLVAEAWPEEEEAHS